MKWFGKAVLNAFGGESAGDTFAIDYLSDTIKVALTTSTYTPNQDTHETFADVTNEVAGTGYSAGGATLAGKTLSYNTSTNVITWDADDVSWPASTITARYAIVYKSTGTASTSPLMGWVDFVSDVSTSNQDFRIVWNSNGLYTVTVS